MNLKYKSKKDFRSITINIIGVKINHLLNSNSNLKAIKEGFLCTRFSLVSQATFCIRWYAKIEFT